MKILVLDNYDSFTYNLVHYIKELGYGQDMDVFRNDQISLEAVEAYDKILLSPGPGIPEEAGILMDLIKTYGPTKGILGVCLGHQGIGARLGGRVVSAPQIMHGKTSPMMKLDVAVKTVNILKDLNSPFEAMRYHSLVVERETLPEELVVTAETDDGVIMAMQHRELPLYGIQFHPESIGTPLGKTILNTFLHG